MLSYAEVFYEGARSCYPRALFSQIKVPPFKEKKGRKKRQEIQITELTHDSLKLTAFRKGKSRKVKIKNYFKNRMPVRRNSRHKPYLMDNFQGTPLPPSRTLLH